MKLFESKVQFKTYELLKSFVELSEFNIKHYSEMVPNYSYGHYLYELGMVRFDLGRQHGHTTAVKKFVENDSQHCKNIIVCRNLRMAQSSYGRKYFGSCRWLGRTPDYPSTLCLSSGTIEGYLNLLRGCRINTPTRVFFDEVSDRKEIIKFLEELGLSHKNIISVVGVGGK